MESDALFHLVFMATVVAGALLTRLGPGPRQRTALRRGFAALGLEATFEPDGVHLRGTVEGIEVLAAPLVDGRSERACLSVRITHPALGGPFTLALGDKPDAPRRPETGDAAFDAQAHLLTLQPMDALAALGPAQRAALLQMAQWGPVRLGVGRLDLLLPEGLRPNVRTLLDRMRVALDGARVLCAPRAADPLPVLLDRVANGTQRERVATARLLAREVGGLPEVRAALDDLLYRAPPSLRWAALSAFGSPPAFDAAAADPQLPDELRLEAWLAGSTAELPADLSLAGPECAEALRRALAAANPRALSVIGHIEDPTVLESLPESHARTEALARLRAGRARRAGQLSLATPGEAGGLRIVDETGALALADRSSEPS